MTILYDCVYTIDIIVAGRLSLKINKSFSLEPRQCKTKLNLSINPETIPILITQEKLNIIQADDNNFYYAIQEIEDITEPANGIEFIQSYWESYLEKLKEHPIGGRKKGHISPYNWWQTAENDFYLIGGKIEGNKVYLKNYIPPEGFESSNKSFIRDVKAGTVHFSVVSYTEDIIETDENGNIKSIKAIRSVRGERNDAVEVDMGAMKQKVNKDDKTSNNNKTEGYIMADNVYNDIVKNLKNQIDNGSVGKPQIAKDLGIEIITDDHKQAVLTVNKITEILGPCDFEKTIQEMKQNAEKVRQQAYDNMREKIMAEVFGPEKIKVNGVDTDNLKRLAAEPLVSKDIQDEKTLKEQIEAAKENPVVKNASFQQADITSDMNDLSGGISVNKNKNTGVRTDEHVEI